MTLEIFSNLNAPGFPEVYSWEGSVGGNSSTATILNRNILQSANLLQTLQLSSTHHGFHSQIRFRLFLPIPPMLSRFFQAPQSPHTPQGSTATSQKCSQSSHPTSNNPGAELGG